MCLGGQVAIVWYVKMVNFPFYVPPVSPTEQVLYELFLNKGKIDHLFQNVTVHRCMLEDLPKNSLSNILFGQDEEIKMGLKYFIFSSLKLLLKTVA